MTNTMWQMWVRHEHTFDVTVGHIQKTTVGYGYGMTTENENDEMRTSPG